MEGRRSAVHRTEVDTRGTEAAWAGSEAAWAGTEAAWAGSKAVPGGTRAETNECIPIFPKKRPNSDYFLKQ